MLTASNLKGNWATLLLPINGDETIHYDKLNDEIDFMIASKVDGIYSNGTAGEFHNQTENEFDKINSLLSDKCKQHGVPFQVGASHPSPIISLERLKRSSALKPDAFQVILPDWVKVTFDEQVEFLQRMAQEAGGTPLVLYNPPHAKQVLTPIEIAKLKAKVDSLIGLKLLSGDATWVQEMKQHVSNLSVFVPGHFLATGVRNQVAHGAYSNVACINPKVAQSWWEMMHTDLESALDLEKRIQEFFKQCIAPLQQRGFSNPALDKFLASVGGWGNVGTRLRWPYQWISETEVPAARAIAKTIIPEFFSA